MPLPKLQLALDFVSDFAGIEPLLTEIIDLVDIVEVGTPLVIHQGIGIVTEIKRTYPQTQVLADLKIIDAGSLEAEIAFAAGADIVTVLGVAHDITINNAVSQARIWDKAVMVDLIAANNVRQRAGEVDILGVDYICVHTAFDAQSQGSNPLEELRLVQEVPKQSHVAVAGGIKPDTLEAILSYQPDVVIVGGFVNNSENKRQSIQAIRHVWE